MGDDGFDPLAFDQDLTPLPEYKPAGDAALDFGGLLPAEFENLYRHLEVFVPLDDIRPNDRPTDWESGKRYS